MAKPPPPDRSIDAMPTKELFIAMLTRDVALIPAIIDLADNCTDGARRVKGDKLWSDLEVIIEATSGKFSIRDNCGGMDVETARKYAFRFGREAGAESTKGEVGRFGVGMKRGLFKLGRHFHIHSTTKKTKFDVTIDVEKWAENPAWQFQFDKTPIEDGDFPASEHGTALTVTKLHERVSQDLSSAQFIQELREQLASRLEKSLQRGLAVMVNGESLKPHLRQLVSDKELAPAKKKFTVLGTSGKPVKVELWCGLGKPESHSRARAESGWYVFCNGRMLLESDKTPMTGWGTEEDQEMPAFHGQFNDFRGFAYLDADEAADLPWNTTKTALDIDHPVYRYVKQQMVLLARPVIDYFNQRKKENDALKESGGDGIGHLQSLFDDAKTKPLADIKTRSIFSAPPPKKIPKAKGADALQSISFKADRDKAEAVKESLEVTSWTKVGEEVFNYYFNAECGDE